MSIDPGGLPVVHQEGRGMGDVKGRNRWIGQGKRTGECVRGERKEV